MPDRVLTEVLGTEKPIAFMSKFASILSHSNAHGRVLVGRYWNDVMDDEQVPNDVQGARTWVNVVESGMWWVMLAPGEG